jgi:hypothetical protein
MLVFRFQERYILHFFAPKKRRNPYSDYLVLVLQQTLSKVAQIVLFKLSGYALDT